MLDSYEDMVPDAAQRIAGLRGFAERFATRDFITPPPPVALAPRTRREEVHRLLVERRDLVDRLFGDLPPSDRDSVAVMVTAMAASMERWGTTFLAQGGVLETTAQLDQYCDDVIGEPARFATALMVKQPLSESQTEQISGVAEFIQLANITRDIERDLERGVAYHPSLRPVLGRSDDEATDAIRGVRSELLARALRRSPAYTSLLINMPLPTVSAGRGSGVVMLLFTDRYYRSCAAKAGHEPWRGPNSTLLILWSGLVAVLSRSWAARVARRVRERMLAAAEAIDDSGISGDG